MKFVIRAGGVGTRLWPYSRALMPKQFHALAGPRTMLQESVGRLQPVAGPEDIYVSTGAQMVDLVRAQLPQLPADRLIVEPALRNTGPAVGLECALLEARHPGCTIASLGSDHYIGKGAEFCRLLRVAAEAAKLHPEYLFTIGVKPVRVETGYGHIRKGAVLDRVQGEAVYQVEEFTEKPDAERAEQYTQSGRYLWNANQFVWKAATVLELFARFEPQLYAGLMKIKAAAGTPQEARVIAAEYPQLQSVAVDNALLERAPQVAALEGDLEWGDIGSWGTLTDVLPADAQGNLFAGQVLALDARQVTAYGPPEKLIALVGVEDLVVVDTPDALLVCRKDQAQRVREVMERLKGEEQYRKYT
ncbi:MAG: mannose-1-phosphate guanylyltransferase [Candidatus Latescibacteria bacterium]|nr:mannose-1-phosphate guanylyltransferase [Candidatus Latescibacterota bacterium]